MPFSLRPFLRQLKRPRVIIPLIVVIGGLVTWRVIVAKDTPGAVTYVTSAARLGNVAITAVGSGQISATDQLSLQPKASGTVISVPVKNGQVVKAGQLVVQLDDTDALQTVRNDENSIASQKLSMQISEEPVDAATLLQSQDDLTQANQSLAQAQTNLATAYDNAYTSISNAFLDLPGVVSGLNDVLNGTEVSTSGQSNANAYVDLIYDLDTLTNPVMNKATSSYTSSDLTYETNFTDYKNSARTNTTAQIATLLSETYNTTLDISDAVKNASNFLDLVNQDLTGASRKLPSQLAGQQSDLESYTNTINGHLTDLLTAENNITSDQQAITDDTSAIAQQTANLAKLQAPIDPLQLQSDQLSLQQKENTLADDESNLSNYSVYAPFAGTIAGLTLVPGDQAGSSTVATLLASQLVANVSLNELDVVNVKIGQPATVTFNALPTLTLPGTVTEINPLGTVSSGVVTYSVQITLTQTDPRIKPSMNVTATIVTQEHDGVITVPNAAVTTSPRGVSTVQELGANGKPAPVTVQIGLTSATLTEITSGVSVGDKVVTRTITATTTAKPASTSTSLIPGATAGVRVGGAAGGFTGGGGYTGGGGGGARPAAGG